MNRPILVCALLAVAAAVMAAQEPSQSSPYEGTSNPPADDTITTSVAEQAKPPAGRPAEAPPPAPAYQAQPAPPPVSADAANSDDGIVQTDSSAGRPRAASTKAVEPDPDGDIVHPRPARTGELGEGTTIRVRLLDRLSTASAEKGEAFRSRVASNVYQGDRVIVPAGAEIDGRVVAVSMGHAGGHGSMRLRPDTIVLPDGSRFHLHAEITGTPGSHTRIGAENSVVPDSRAKRDGIEYGGVVGGGAVTGAVMGGPVGALAGGLVGAGVVTAHLLASHPQATLETGTVLLFTLTEPLDLIPAEAPSAQ